MTEIQKTDLVQLQEYETARRAYKICTAGLGSLGLVPCNKKAEYVVMQLQAKVKESDHTHWGLNYSCTEHLAGLAEIFIPDPTEIRIVPLFSVHRDLKRGLIVRDDR